MIKIELTTDQANILLQFIEFGIKSGGYKNAKVGVPLIDIILEADKAAEIPSQQQEATN